jgi:hypothetical protein
MYVARLGAAPVAAVRAETECVGRNSTERGSRHVVGSKGETNLEKKSLSTPKPIDYCHFRWPHNLQGMDVAYACVGVGPYRMVDLSCGKQKSVSQSLSLISRRLTRQSNANDPSNTFHHICASTRRIARRSWEIVPKESGLNLQLEVLSHGILTKQRIEFCVTTPNLNLGRDKSASSHCASFAALKCCVVRVHSLRELRALQRTPSARPWRVVTRKLKSCGNRVIVHAS